MADEWRKPQSERFAELQKINAELLAALENIANHDPETCNGLTPRDCLDAVREIARAAILKAKGK
jgi:hypothetical protein